MRIAVLFDGGGLARLGLEKAGHECIGVELDPIKHYLSKFVGKGNCILQDATTFNTEEFDAVWASPPCQKFSAARTQGECKSQYSGDYLDFCLDINTPVLWVENVVDYFNAAFGKTWNAAQFLQQPIQCRNRIVGGSYKEPWVWRRYKKHYMEFDLCPAITATEYKGCGSDTRRASRFYGRRLTLEECAYHQGFEIPYAWQFKPHWFNGPYSQWINQLYETIGNGVPVYMAKAFGDAYKDAI